MKLYYITLLDAVTAQRVKIAIGPYKHIATSTMHNFYYIDEEDENNAEYLIMCIGVSRVIKLEEI